MNLIMAIMTLKAECCLFHMCKCHRCVQPVFCVMHVSFGQPYLSYQRGTATLPEDFKVKFGMMLTYFRPFS